MVRARMARLFVQPCDVGLAIIPTNAHHRFAVGLCKAGIFPGQLWILLPFEDGAAAAATVTGRVSRLPSKCRVLATSNVVIAQCETRQRDLVLWRFISYRFLTAAVT